MNKIVYVLKYLPCFCIICVFVSISHAGQDKVQLRSPDNKALFVFEPDKSKFEYSVLSPDKKVEVRVSSNDGLKYTVLMEGETIIEPSKLGLQLSDGKEIGQDIFVRSASQGSFSNTWQTVAGPRKDVSNKYHEMALEVSENNSSINYSLEFRVYNEGAAFRYVFAKSNPNVRLQISEELTEYNFADDYTCWPLFLGSYTTMQEALFPESKLSDILPGSIVCLPLTVDLGAKGYCSIAEAALVDYAGAYIISSDTMELYSSPELTGGGLGVKISVDISSDIDQIMLTTNSLGSINHDHVDFADTKIFRADGSFAWLSDLTPKYSRQDWGELHFDQSIDGNPILIGGQSYSKGLGTHANSVILFDIGSEFIRFETIVGIDSEVGNNGRAKVSVYANKLSQEKNSLRTSLSRQNGQTAAVDVDTPCSSPWRVIMTGRKPVDLLNSDLIVNLNEASKISDTSWIKPGVASWNWLTTFHSLDMEVLKEFIDLSAKMNWEYCIIDDGWYKNGNCTTSQDHLNIPELVDYAVQRNVKLWLWVHWESLNDRMEEAMSLYEDWGIVGIKVDFMSRDDQWMVDWYQKCLETAASHKLMVNLHGCYKPTGVRRTWPNLMTREAVYGLEQNFASNNDPEHKTILPFTRMLVGPMDYTPGSFRNETKDTWRSTTPVSTLGTRCQEMALCLIYDSPVLNMADSLSGYTGEKGLGFLNGLPTSWDDTIALDGEIGGYYLSARRKGNNWFIGGITNWDERTMEIALDFLAASKTYEMTIYEDGSGAFSDNARDVNIRQIIVSSTDRISLKLASGGGFTAALHCLE